MKRRCNPRFIQNTHRKAHSWRKAARELNELYGVNLFHLTWRNYATGRRDISDPATRAALMLGPRPCPACGHKTVMQLSHLLKRLMAKDLRKWNQMRENRQYKTARHLLDEVNNRKTKTRW
jgi:hypothetical protein